jgi:hypothetical protein
MIMYKLLKNPITNETTIVLRLADNLNIPMVNDNTDYQAYLKFIADGGQPLPADEVTSA